MTLLSHQISSAIIPKDRDKSMLATEAVPPHSEEESCEGLSSTSPPSTCHAEYYKTLAVGDCKDPLKDLLWGEKE